MLHQLANSEYDYQENNAFTQGQVNIFGIYIYIYPSNYQFTINFKMNTLYWEIVLGLTWTLIHKSSIHPLLFNNYLTNQKCQHQF